MATVVTFAPIAAQLARAVPLDVLFPPGDVEEMLQEQRQRRSESDEPPLSEDAEAFMAHYFILVRAASQLLGAPPFRALAQLQKAIEEEYMPGGPPQSPIYDSFAFQFVLSSVPQGVGSETPYSVLARLLQRAPGRARLQALAQALADSSLELYRVSEASGVTAQIERVRGGDALHVSLTGPFLRNGDFGLMRVLPFDGQYFIADSPYLLRASEGDWLEYLARVAAAAEKREPGASPGTKSGNLTSKQQARARQKQKEKDQRHEPEAVIARHLKFGSSPRFWFDYAMDAYAGERRGIVFLAGVPDRPRLLPHSRQYQGGSEPQLPPDVVFRRDLLKATLQEGLLEQVTRELGRLVETNGRKLELTRNEQQLLGAYAMYGLRGQDATNMLTRFVRSHAAPAQHPEVRAFIESIERGWFTVFRIDRIHLDQGFEAFDLLRGEALQIRERSATRQVAAGDLILGWVQKDAIGGLSLEGGIAHVPAGAAAAYLARVGDVTRRLPPPNDDDAWKVAAVGAVLPLVANLVALRLNLPAPTSPKASKEPPPPATAHYRILPRGRARIVATLKRELQTNDDGSYSWVAGGIALARVELGRGALRVHATSPQRLGAAQQLVEALLGGDIERGPAPP